MKKLSTLLMALMLMSTALWADETITVSANSSDISEGLDLKVVAKLFAEAKNLEEFENMLNNPDSAFCNLDLNGDGQVDYLRVVETGEGNKRLIVLQAILAKDIYQDVASIYVEKDEKNEVSVQVVGDEYVYGANYIIEPVYVYRPYLYDWFWSPGWYAWHSPWYWGYYPGWWYVHSCWAHDWYWHHCYTWHHHHYGCSFRPGRHTHHGYHELRPSVSRNDYAVAHPDRSFERRNSGMTNAREICSTHRTTVARSTQVSGDRQSAGAVGTRQATTTQRSTVDSRTFGSRTTAAQRSATAQTAQRSATTTTQRSTATGTQRATTTTATAQRSSTQTAQRGTTSSTRSSSTAVAQRPASTTTQRSTASTTQRSSASTTRTSSVSSQPSRSSSSSYSSSGRSSSSSSSTTRSTCRRGRGSRPLLPR